MDFFSNLFSGGGADNLSSTGINMDSILEMSPEALGQLDFSGVQAGALGTDPGFFAQLGTGLGNIGNSLVAPLGDKGTTNLLSLGLQGAGLANQYQGQRQANKLAKRYADMDTDAYRRNVEADDRRRQIRF